MIKIFGMPWHAGHQHELFKLPWCEFSLLVNMRRTWAYKSRPLPDNVKMVPYYERGKYDLAILHVDQQSVSETIGKARLFREVDAEVADIPKIVINHGSPVWPEMLPAAEVISKMKTLVGGKIMVVNSRRAAEEWGFGIPIVHGYDPGEWFDLPKEPRIITAVSPAGLDMYYNRELFVQTQEILAREGIKIIELRTDVELQSFEEYRKYIGSSLIYFDYSLETPLNRSRTEAMLSGCCVVTAAGHDTERFIRDGENAMLIKNNPKHAAKVLSEMFCDYERCLKIGQDGKKTAREFFSQERYQREWLEILKRVLIK